jgi:hypothetical protein
MTLNAFMESIETKSWNETLKNEWEKIALKVWNVWHFQFQQHVVRKNLVCLKPKKEGHLDTVLSK